jgi:hypothetical protein
MEYPDAVDRPAVLGADHLCILPRDAPRARLEGRQGRPFVYLASRNREDDAIAYRIEKADHDVVDALRRIALEEVEGAVASAEGAGDLAGRIHDIRKRMKKLRGLIRLVRPVFPDYRVENAHFLSPILAGRVIAICIPAIILLSTLCAATPTITLATPAEASSEIPNERNRFN